MTLQFTAWHNLIISKPIEFDWYRWKIQKNELKHGVSRTEAESAFFDPHYLLFVDRKHSTSLEKRYILYGKGSENRVLMLGFTLRGSKVRIITARSASRKERSIYEQQ